MTNQTGITYTFPSDFRIAKLAGKTLTGGEWHYTSLGLDTPDAVIFPARLNGMDQRVVARIAGKPELEALLAEREAANQARNDRLAAIGWPQYEAAQARVINAHGAYDRASEHGYPAREAAKLQEAEAALEAAKHQYPQAAAYALAVAYSESSNYDKAGIGRDAMQAIEQGADAEQAATKMQADWADTASRLVDNS